MAKNQTSKKKSGDGKTEEPKTDVQPQETSKLATSQDTNETSGDGKTEEPETTSSSETEPHIVTKTDLENNPELGENGVKEGDEIGLPKEEKSHEEKWNEFLSEHRNEGSETEAEKQVVDAPIETEEPAKNAADVFNTKPLHETPPNPHKPTRVPGVKVPPPPSGGWHLFIDPVTSAKSVVTFSAKKILLKEKTHLRYLGPCDEKGNLLTDGKA